MTRIPRSHLPQAFLDWIESTMNAGRYEQIPRARLEALANTYRLWRDPQLPLVFPAADDVDEDDGQG